MKKLSIITINYNNRDGLRKTIESVVAQTTRDFEYIVIDGGSTDGSVDVIKEYASYIDYWVSEPDKGIYNAMNKGIDQATGDYCLFLNSGDWLYNSDVIQNIYHEVNDSSYTFVFGKINIVSRDGKCVLGQSVPENTSGYYLFKGNLPHQSTLTQTAVLKQYHYRENYNIVSDWLFAVEMILLHNASTRNIHTIISNFMLDGISSTKYQLVAAEREQGFKNILGKVISDDYHKLCYGETFLEILIRKTEKFSGLYKLMLIWNLPIAGLYKLRNFIHQHL